MTTAPVYEVKVWLPERSEAWADAEAELPRGAKLVEAYLLFVPDRVTLVMQYLGVKPDGTRHRRISRQEVTLDPTAAGTGPLIKQAFGSSEYTKTFSAILPREIARLHRMDP